MEERGPDRSRCQVVASIDGGENRICSAAGSSSGHSNGQAQIGRLIDVSRNVGTARAGVACKRERGVEGTIRAAATTAINSTAAHEVVVAGQRDSGERTKGGTGRNGGDARNSGRRPLAAGDGEFGYLGKAKLANCRHGGDSATTLLQLNGGSDSSAANEHHRQKHGGDFRKHLE